jgi:hypothetical protein
MFWHNLSENPPITKYWCLKKNRVVKKTGTCEKYEVKDENNAS